MVNHAERAHAKWSASKTALYWNCAGALAMVEEMNLPDKTSEAAAWGTACHEVAEICLREDRDALELIDRSFTRGDFTHVVDEEMAETAQEYVDYVRGRAAVYNDQTSDQAVVHIERKFKLDDLNPPFDAGGTGDAILYFPKWKLLEIIDLKGGRGVVVEADNNKQMRTYALGAMLEFKGLEVKEVMSTIVQPRAYHREGRIRSEKIHVIDLMEWTQDLVAAMRTAKQAESDLAAAKGNAVASDLWAETYLKPGDHCHDCFCPVAGACPALKAHAFNAVGVFFDDLDQPTLKNTPDMLSPEELAKVLDASDLIEGFIKAARALGHTLAEGGVEVPGYILVEKVGRRKFTLSDKELRAELLKRGGSEDDILAEPKLKPMGQLEKVFGKGGLDDLIEKPVTGTNLVRADKTTREAVTPLVNQMFDVLD